MRGTRQTHTGETVQCTVALDCNLGRGQHIAARKKPVGEGENVAAPWFLVLCSSWGNRAVHSVWHVCCRTTVVRLDSLTCFVDLHKV